MSVCVHVYLCVKRLTSYLDALKGRLGGTARLHRRVGHLP